MPHIGSLEPFPDPATGSGASLTSLTGTSGGAVGPNASGNINLAGTNVTIAGNPATHTLTFTSSGGGGGSGGTITTYTTNSGTATPDNAGGLNVLGNTTQGISISGSGNSMTVTGLSATTGQIGVVALASDLQTTAGANSTNAVVPSSLAAKLGTQTTNAIPYSTGASNAFSWLGPLTDGQLIIGST